MEVTGDVPGQTRRFHQQHLNAGNLLIRNGSQATTQPVPRGGAHPETRHHDAHAASHSTISYSTFSRKYSGILSPESIKVCPAS